MADSKEKPVEIVPAEGAQVIGGVIESGEGDARVYIVNGVKVDPNGQPVK